MVRRCLGLRRSLKLVSSRKLKAIANSLTETVTVQKGDSFVTAIPADTLRFTYGIAFPTKAIGEQWFSWSPTIADFSERFALEIAPARTFTLAAYIEQARAAGLIKGGTLENHDRL